MEMLSTPVLLKSFLASTIFISTTVLMFVFHSAVPSKTKPIPSKIKLNQHRLFCAQDCSDLANAKFSSHRQDPAKGKASWMRCRLRCSFRDRVVLPTAAWSGEWGAEWGDLGLWFYAVIYSVNKQEDFSLQGFLCYTRTIKPPLKTLLIAAFK